MLKRLTEPSTYAGLAAAIYGGSALPPIFEPVAQSGSTGSMLQGAFMLISGILAMFMREKGNRY